MDGTRGRCPFAARRRTPWWPDQNPWVTTDGAGGPVGDGAPNDNEGITDMFHPDLYLDLFRQEQTRRDARLGALANQRGSVAPTRRTRRRRRSR